MVIAVNPPALCSWRQQSIARYKTLQYRGQQAFRRQGGTIHWSAAATLPIVYGYKYQFWPDIGTSLKQLPLVNHYPATERFPPPEHVLNKFVYFHCIILSG
jgi:hypothetical protein